MILLIVSFIRVSPGLLKRQAARDWGTRAAGRDTGASKKKGAQKVNAPFSQNVKKGNGQVKTGNDLRTGSSGSGKSGK